MQQRANNNNKKGVSNLKLERGRIQFLDMKWDFSSWESFINEDLTLSKYELI